MDNQQWNQGPVQEPFTAQQPQQQAYGGTGWQQPQQPYANAGYEQQPPAYPVQQLQKPQSRLSGGWKVLYAVLGIFAPIIALLVAFLKSRNSKSGDAEIRESVNCFVPEGPGLAKGSVASSVVRSLCLAHLVLASCHEGMLLDCAIACVPRYMGLRTQHRVIDKTRFLLQPRYTQPEYANKPQD